MLSIQNHNTWETITININNKSYELASKSENTRKIVFLLTKMMESIYFRLWDLVIQARYTDIKKAKMKTELKRITIGTVEKALTAIRSLSDDMIIDEISRFFIEKDHHFCSKIKDYANYAIDDNDMKPYFIDSANEIAELEYQKLTRRFELNDFDFSRRPSRS